jgi:hypothetical protein
VSGFVLSLVILDVDSFIVARNGERFAASADLDVAYLNSLSDDAVPGLVALAGEIRGEDAQDLLAGLSCRRHAIEAAERRQDWPSAHASRSRALAALAAVDAALDAYPVYLDYHGSSDTRWATYVVKTADGFEPCRSAVFD